ncbi:MAG TPA: DUF1287 domain-containing protein [Haliangiales bacterium]|nr:DUF1287 domain-containing protein [Haliangiales bacterium]
MLSLALAFTLGVADRGIFPDLDDKVAIALPKLVDPNLTLDARHHVIVVWDRGRPVKVYPEKPTGAEAAELAPLVAAHPPRVVDGIPDDRDDDGIPDALDILIGAKKVALNAASYGGDYIPIKFPGGDLPRDMGVCTDVIVRALRNAGIDLQKEIYDDIGRAPRAYPMVKKRDPNIDQRRVKTMERWFQRHWEAHGTDPASKTDPFLPGDVVFFDTFPSRPGPDHVGVVSDRIGPSGLPLIVNNWTDGFKEGEMDLLLLVPVTNRYRVK